MSYPGLMVRSCLFALLCGTASSPSSSRAQSITIHGGITDQVSGKPIPAAHVLALDAGGEVLARAWSNSAGQYDLILKGTSSADAPSTVQFNVGRVFPHPALPGEIQIPYYPGPDRAARPALEVFDVWGRRVEGAIALAAGLYFYRLQLGNQRTSHHSLILARGGPVTFRLMEMSPALDAPGGAAKSLRAAAISIRVEKPGFRQVRQDLTLGDGTLEIDFQLGRADGGRSRLVLALRDENDQALSSGRATVHDLALTSVANAFGEIVLDSVYSGVATVVHLERDGYMDQVVRMEIPAGLGLFRREVVMPQRGEGQMLSDAAEGGEAQGADGARLELPPGALVANDGTPVSGPILVYMTPINVMTPTGYAAFPGELLGIDATGREGPLLSYGATDFVLEQGGQELDLAANQTAIIEMPLYATVNERAEPLEPGDAMPIWWFEETTGVWRYESMGTVVSAPSSPTGLALRGPVSHFSLFNCDVSPVAAAADLFALLDDDTCDVLGGTSSSAGCHGPAGFVRYDANLPDGYPRSSASGHAFIYDPETGLLDLPLPEGVSRAISATVAPEGFRMSTFLPADVDVELQVTTQGGRLRNRAGLWAGRWSETFRPTPNGQHSLQIQFDYALLSEGGRNEPLPVPASVLRSIDVDGEVDDFWFTGTVGAIAQLEACRLPASELEAEVALRSPSAITLDGTSLGESCARLHHQLAEAGKHVVAVRGLYGTTGGYELTLDVASGLTPLVYYDSTFTAEVLRHRFGFTLNEPQTVVVGTRPTSGSVLGMRSELQDVSGTMLDVRTANTLSTAEIVHTLPAGTYYITQTLQAEPPASYTLALLPLAPPTPINANTAYEGTISLPFLRERFSLTVVETAAVAVVTEPSDDLRLWTRLLDASGNQIASTLSGRLERTLEVGEYLVEMDGHLMDVGAYGFMVEVD